MASGFVEQATLKVNDQSSAAIAKINAELNKLAQAARSLKSIQINIRVNDRAVQQAIRNMRSLQRMTNVLGGHRGSTNLNVHVNTRGLTQAQNQINNLRAQAARPIIVNTQAGAGGGRGGAAGRGLRQTGIQYQMGNFSVLRGAASVVIGGTAYAVAANAARTAISGVMDSEDARMRLRQSGFTEPQTDLFMAMARKTQEEFSRIPAAAIANASVEQLNALKANNATFADYQAAMNRIAANAQRLAITFKDSAQGAEGARQLERVSQIMGHDVNDAEIRKLQEATMRAVVATGGEIKIEEAVRVLQQLGSSLAKSLSPQALSDILMVRDEGGRASTAEWRTAVQELMRGNLNKKDKAAMVRAGLRKAGGVSDPAVVQEASKDLVGFTEKRLVPLVAKAGLAKASSAEIATFLDEVIGFGTVSARGFADIITSLRSGEFQRQRAAGRAVNLDPHLGDKTFRGGADRLRASFQTALARPLDKMGPAFTDAITPFALSMDKAGKAAEKGDYGGAALEMAKGVSGLMGGPAGAVLTTISAANAIQTLLDPTASPLEKGSAMLVTGSSALLTAAGAISNYFGGGDPATELSHQQMLQRQFPEKMASLKRQEEAAQAAVDKDPTVRNRQRLATIKRLIETEENQQRDVERNIIAAQARVDALKADEARIKAEEAAEMERLQRESGLGGAAAAPAAAKASVLTAEALKQLQQLGAGGGLAGVKSIVNLLKMLGQPTSLAAREDLAKRLGYTGPLGGSAAMNAFLLDFFKKLATAIPEPPKVTSPPPAETQPPPPAVTPPPPATEVPPATDPALKPPIEVVPGSDKPVPVAPVTPPSAAKPPLVQPPQTGTGAGKPTPPAPGKPGGGASLMGAPISLASVIDPTTVPPLFTPAFSAGVTALGGSGTTVGNNALSAMNAGAGGVGAAIGAAFVAVASGVSIGINPAPAPTQSARVDTGGQTA